MNPYSPDLRQRVLAALRTHLDTQKDVAQCFSVCLSTVEKWWHAWRTSRRSHAHRRKHAGPRRTLADSGPFLRATLKHQPDLTLAELSACVLAEQQVVASPSMLCRELHRLRLPRKQKSLQDSQRKTPRVRRLRRQFVVRQAAELDALLEKLHFIDEFGVVLGMTRTHGRAAPGVRVVETTPAASSPRYTGIAALSLKGIKAPWFFRGGMDALGFETYMLKVLLPTLHREDCVILDNFSAHTSQELRRTLEARGIRLVFLPPYSPDLNPVELCWSKVKTALRAAKACTFDALVDALADALHAVTRADARAWFAHCGYVLP